MWPNIVIKSDLFQGDARNALGKDASALSTEKKLPPEQGSWTTPTWAVLALSRNDDLIFGKFGKCTWNVHVCGRVHVKWNPTEWLFCK